MIEIKTIDAHVGGQPLRLIVAGAPSPSGRTMLDKTTWLLRHAERVRRAVVLEPRGHADMCAAVLTEPVSPGSHAGLLFMHGDGYSPMSAHGVIAAATIALEKQIIVPGGDGRSVSFDTIAGTIRATAHWAAHGEREPRVERVSFVNVPSFVLQGGVDVTLGTRHIKADVAFGGGFYAIVDAESAGVPLDGSRLPELRRVGMAIRQATDVALKAAHPFEPALAGIHGTIFTAPPRSHSADLRSVTVIGDGGVDRSACGTGVAAVMAVIDAMGLLDDRRPFVSESLIGTTLLGRVAHRTLVGDYPAIVPEIEGTAWTTGTHTFFADDEDPLREGFRV